MQFILTQEEKDNLVPKTEMEDRDKALEIARKKILKHSGFTCIHDDSDEYALCDSCPCLLNNKEQKEIGNAHKSHRIYSLICNLRKEFSK